MVTTVNLVATPSSTSVSVVAVELVAAVATPSSTSVSVAAVELVAAVVTLSSTSVSVAAQDSVFADSLANAATPLRSLIMMPKRV